MPRAIWSGSISFGLVMIPVKLYSAVSRKDVRFHQLRASDGVRVRQKRVAETDGDEVPYEQIVRGYEWTPDNYVIVRNEELEAIAPEVTRTIEIEEFVEIDEIDPIYWESTYYLVPDKGAARPYSLLLRAMADAGRVGIGRIVLRTKEYLAAIRPDGPVLALSTMLYADEVVSPESIDGVPDEADVSDRELAVARQLVESLSAEFDPARHHDTYRERVLELVRAKAEGREIVTREAPEQPAPATDLMAALEASLAAARGKSDTAGGDGAKAAPPAKGKRASSASGGRKRAAKKAS